MGREKDKLFRRSFSHLQDAGQERCFFVEFQGEGVEDYGGPYRAVFTNAAVNESCGPLELFQPSVNQQEDSGRSRHLFTLNRSHPENEGVLKLNHFEFLGKLLGTAHRHRIMLALDLSPIFWKRLCGREPTLKDLEEVDESFVKCFEQMNKLEEDVMEDDEITDWSVQT